MSKSRSSKRLRHLGARGLLVYFNSFTWGGIAKKALTHPFPLLLPSHLRPKLKDNRKAHANAKASTLKRPT